MITMLSLCSVFAISLAVVVCRRKNPTLSVSADTQVVVLISRSLQTGRFQAFEIRDCAFVEQARSALKEDLRHPDKYSKHGLGVSVNHALAFCGADGNVVLISILGDHYIALGSMRCSAEQTMAAIRTAHSRGVTSPISAERAKHLAPVLDRYL